MNKMHTVAKIAAGITGIYLLIFTVLTLMRNLSFVFMDVGKGNTPSLMTVVISLLVTLGFAGAVFYFLIYRSDLFANKIVGKEEFPDGGYTLNWFPFAMRLAVVIAGFLFLQKTITLSSSLVHYIRYSFPPGAQGGMWQVYEYGIYLLIYLAIAIYLLAGAPHFVRWQIKKTARLCKEFSEK